MIKKELGQGTGRWLPLCLATSVAGSCSLASDPKSPGLTLSAPLSCCHAPCKVLGGAEFFYDKHIKLGTFAIKAIHKRELNLEHVSYNTHSFSIAEWLTQASTWIISSACINIKIYYTIKVRVLASGFYQSLMYVMFTSIRGEKYNKPKKLF